MFGLRRFTTNFTGIDLAKNWSDEETVKLFTCFEDTPLPNSLFCGLTFELLETEAELTVEFISSLFILANDSILKKDLFEPTQLTINELKILEKDSLASSLAKNIEFNLVFVSTIKGAMEVSYHWSIVGESDPFPTYWITTNGFGLIVFVALEFPSNLTFLNGRVTTPLLIT